jgi:hypothetical protein
VVNDFTSPGPIWDPTLSAYYYSYTASSDTNGTFVGSDSSTPAAWLYYFGRWGDEQYPDSDPRQVNLGNLNITWKYESGPTGPLDKSLNRTDVCPTVAGTNCTTLSVLPAASGSSIPVTVTRTTSSQNPSTTAGASKTTSSGSAGSTGSSTTSATGSPIATAKGGVGKVGANLGVLFLVISAVLSILC